MQKYSHSLFFSRGQTMIVFLHFELSGWVTLHGLHFRHHFWAQTVDR